MLKTRIFKSFDKQFCWSALKIFFPIILAGIVQASIGFIDNIAVSGSTVHDGIGAGMDKIDLKAVGTGNEIFFVTTGFGMASSILFGVLYAQFSNKKMEFSEVFKLSIWFVTIFSVAISIISFLFADQFIGIFFNINAGRDKALVVKHGGNFIRIMAISNFFFCLSINMINPLTIKGKVRYALYLSLLSLLINVVLDFTLIYGFNLGAEGSAWATAFSFMAQFILCSFFMLKHRDWFEGVYKIFTIHKQIFKEALKRIYLFLFFILMQSSFVIITILWSSLYSSNYIAGLTTGYIVADLMFATFAACSKAVSIFIGPLLGDNKMEKAKKVSKKLMWPVAIITVSSMACAGIISTFFPMLMLNSARDIWTAQWVIIVFVMAFPLYMGVTYLSALFEVGGKQFVPNFWNRGFPIWTQMPLTALLSPLLVNMNWELAFFITNTITFIPFIVLIVLYKKFKWLKQIKVS